VSVANENIPRSDRERAEGFRRGVSVWSTSAPRAFAVSVSVAGASERVRARADGVWGVGDPFEAGT
jgi:hypothetical protein